MKADNTFIQILETCLVIDKAAKDIYLSLAGKTGDNELREFWEMMARDEQTHIDYWEKLTDVVCKGGLPNIFDSPMIICDHLAAVRDLCHKILHDCGKVSDTGTAFLLAYHLEFYLVHPAFEALFHLMRQNNGGAAAEEDYSRHIKKFIDGFRKFNQNKPELLLFCQFLEKIWDETKRVSSKIGSVYNLEGLIPVCADCKKIFNENGTWEKMEYFIRLTPHMSFTHWICPECLHKNYPEHLERRRKKAGKHTG